jgi:hypothetical protein
VLCPKFDAGVLKTGLFRGNPRARREPVLDGWLSAVGGTSRGSGSPAVNDLPQLNVLKLAFDDIQPLLVRNEHGPDPSPVPPDKANGSGATAGMSGFVR